MTFIVEGSLLHRDTAGHESAPMIGPPSLRASLVRFRRRWAISDEDCRPQDARAARGRRTGGESLSDAEGEAARGASRYDPAAVLRMIEAIAERSKRKAGG